MNDDLPRPSLPAVAVPDGELQRVLDRARLRRRARAARAGGVLGVAVLAVAVLVNSGDPRRDPVTTVSAPEDTTTSSRPRSTSTTTATTVPAPRAAPTSTTFPAATTTTTVDPTFPPGGDAGEVSTLRGLVVDPSGQALGGTHVYLNYGPSVAVTGADGSYEIDCPAGPVLLYGVGPTFNTMPTPAQNWAPAIVGGGADMYTASPPDCGDPDSPPIVTVMQRGGMVTGLLLGENGEPMPNTGVAHGGGSTDINVSLPGTWPGFAQLSASTDATGRYWFVGLPQGGIRITSGMRNFPHGSSVELTLAADEVAAVDWAPDGAIIPGTMPPP